MSVKSHKVGGRWWRLTCYLIALLVALPVITVTASWLLPASEHWQHIIDTSLAQLIINSFYLLGLVGLGTTILGVSLGWIVSQYDFPGRNYFKFALLFPLAIPAYVIGFVYLGSFEYAGPLFSTLRAGGYHGYFDIKNIFGVSAILTLALFPYVFLLAEQGFTSLSSKYFEAARSLGESHSRVFFSVGLPMIRPWLFVALSLVGMETLADFGTVSIFVVDTFSTAIYKAWYGFFSTSLAAQLASSLLLFITLLLVFEAVQRRGKSFTSSSAALEQRTALRGRSAFVCTMFCSLVLFCSFVGPLLQLLSWSLQLENINWQSLWEVSWHSILIGLVVAVLVTAGALVVVYGKRFFPGQLLEFVSKFAVFGYAIPGSVLAIGVFLPLSKLDNLVADTLASLTGFDPGLVLTGSFAALVLGLFIRFLAVGHANISAAAERVSTRLDEAATNFGSYGFDQMRRLHVPIIWPALAASFTLTFVDVIKEMPLTLMTRPFGWNTLAVKIFELISEGEWQLAALPAMLLAAISLVIMVVFGKKEKL